MIKVFCTSRLSCCFAQITTSNQSQASSDDCISRQKPDQILRSISAGSDEKDDIAAQLGAGSAASDAELDRIKDATEAEILGRTNLVGRFAPLVAAFCHQRQV